MELRKHVLRVEHPDTLLSIGNLAHTYNKSGTVSRSRRVTSSGNEYSHQGSGERSSTYVERYE